MSIRPLLPRSSANRQCLHEARDGVGDDVDASVYGVGSICLGSIYETRWAEKVDRLKVRDGLTPVDQLNELEFVEGQLFANVWHSNRIARISPQTGDVVGWIDLTEILSPVYRLDSEAVLNGIAYDPIQKRLFVTGKLWPSVYEIRLAPKHRR
jgi:glutamine cyclotransferase